MFDLMDNNQGLFSLSQLDEHKSDGLDLLFELFDGPYIDQGRVGVLIRTKPLSNNLNASNAYEMFKNLIIFSGQLVIRQK